MSIPFTRWPEEFARRYREKGYWQDLPLTDILTRHAASDSIAVIDGDRQSVTPVQSGWHRRSVHYADG